jgi:peptide/nickel transport system permease protein
VGAACAHWRAKAMDRALSGLTLTVMAMPGFWLGLLAISLFAVRLGWLPAGGRLDAAHPGGLWDHIRHLLMPAGILGLVLGARWSRYMRAALTEVAQAAPLKVARSRGLPPWRLLWRHTLWPALPTLANVVAVEAPGLFAGALLTETVFGWPGMGRLFHDGLQRRDEPRLLAILLLTSVLIVAFNLLADLSHQLLDPRLKIHGRA